MSPVEDEVVQKSLAQLRKLVPQLVQAQDQNFLDAGELSSHLESMVVSELRAWVRELSHRDILRQGAHAQARVSKALADSKSAQLENAGLPRFEFDRLVHTSKLLRASRDQEHQVRAVRSAAYLRAALKKLPDFQASLREAAEDYQQTARRMSDFFGTTSGLWDRRPGQWRDINWADLDQAASLTKEWPEIRELAKRLGRKWSSATAPQAHQEDMAAAEERFEELREFDTGRSEITGMTQGRNLSALAANELAMLSDADGELLFMKRYAEGTLANVEYKTKVRLTIERTRQDSSTPQETPQDQGPVIICVDSSGSMTGMPERVAKALCLALIRACGESGRSCYLIAFSHDIQCIDVSKPLTVLDELLAFMAHSFRGGTDLRPALYKSLELLDTPEWMNSDLLIISDFRVPKLMIKKSNLIDPIRTRHEARLHALSIAAHDPVDDLHIFDSHWHFRTGIKGEGLGISSSQFKEM